MLGTNCYLGQSSLHIAFQYVVINQGSKNIHKQNGQHDSFRVSRVHHADDNAHKADQKTMLAKLDDKATSHEERASIGVRVACWGMPNAAMVGQAWGCWKTACLISAGCRLKVVRSQ